MKISAFLEIASIVGFGFVTAMPESHVLTTLASTLHAHAGLNPTQSHNAAAIIQRARQDGVGRLGCETAITTALTESNLYILANRSVPSSMVYPHDGFGADQDSVGLFQHRALFYRNIACTMDATCSAGLFFTDLKAVPGWRNMGTAVLSQAVQRSQIPDAYKRQQAWADRICAAAGGF